MKAGIALGSNLGDRLGHLRKARLDLTAIHTGNHPPLQSRIYETEPVDCEPGTASFLNAVIEIEHAGPALDLLRILQRLEVEMGRPSRRPRNAPRPIDLDLLYFGEEQIHVEGLTVPHPRLATRRFVLAPLADIRPDLQLPGQQETVSALLSKLPETPATTLVPESW